MDRAVARAEKWRKKHNRVTSTLVWRVYSPFDRALCRIRTVLCPAHPATEVMAIAQQRKVAAAKDLAPADIETRKNDRAIGVADSSFGKKGGDQLSSDGGDQSTAPHANEESRAPTLYRGPSLETLKSTPQRGRIAVVIHLFYPELWPEFRDALTFIPEPFDLFITLVAGHSEEGEDWIRADYPVAQIVTVENRGRDILPFILLINSGVLDRYHLVCKLHTKRTLRREDGDDWRRALLGGVLLDEVHVASILAAFDADPELGIVVADGCIWSDNKNVDRLNELCACAGIPGVTAESGYPDFPAGSIFWIRSSLLRPIASLMLEPTDFEPEPLPRDGCMPHAVERFIGHVCHQAGMRVAESSACNTGQKKVVAPTKEYRPVTRRSV
jgi:Rhamnan synthesis protein F